MFVMSNTYDTTGLVTNKVYADGKGPTYTYTPEGKLATRTWARGDECEMLYDENRRLQEVSYSSADTPCVVFERDRFGMAISGSMSNPTFHVRDKKAGIYWDLRPRSSLHLRFVREIHFSKVKCPAMDYASANSNDFCSALAKVRLAVFLSLCRPQKHADIISKSAMLSKGVGLHYTAFRDVNPEKPPIATQYRQLSMRKKSERRLNVESRDNGDNASYLRDEWHCISYWK